MSLRPSAELSTGYLRMKSAAEDYLPMNSNDYLTAQSTAQFDDVDDDVMKQLQPAAAAANTSNAGILSSTQDSSEKPLLTAASPTAPHVKYSALQQYDS